jgi:hypothetical protein
VFVQPGQDFATILVKWLSVGAPTETRDAHAGVSLSPAMADPSSDLPPQSPATRPRSTPPPAGANGPHVNRTDRQVESAKAELIMNIIGALNKKFPGEDKTARQDRSDMSRELFGVAAADLKALPLSILQAGYERLTRPAIG